MASLEELKAGASVKGLAPNEPIFREAARWMAKAANQGHAEAQKKLGDYYRVGQGVQKSYREAVKWYRKAAQQGLAAGQYYLGNLYKDGRASPRNYRAAVKWYLAAAEQGHYHAQISLAEMYHKVKGFPVNYMLAYMWMSLALANDAPPADASALTHSGRSRRKKICERFQTPDV